MTYFQDLTPYAYYGNEEALNIGWLSKNETFITGETSREFRERLYKFCLDVNIVKIMRGFQECEFCELSWSEWGKNHPSYGEQAKLMSLGDGEIRVIGKSSSVYAAPALIYHYVVEHHYKPPQEFIDAVLNGPQPGSTEHNALLEKYRMK